MYTWVFHLRRLKKKYLSKEILHYECYKNKLIRIIEFSYFIFFSPVSYMISGYFINYFVTFLNLMLNIIQN